MSKTFDALRRYVFELEIVDTHEHLPPFEHERPKNTDVLSEYLTHYFSCDLVSAGLSDEGIAFARDAKKPLGERWKTVAPFWEAARHTGYGRSLDIAARELYGIDRIDGETIEALDEAFRDAREKGGHYRRVLKEKSRIAVSIEDWQSACVVGAKTDKDIPVDVEYFRPVVRADGFIAPGNTGELKELSALAGVPIHTLADLKAGVEAYLDKSLAKGAVGLKSGFAYQRPLRFEKVSEADASRDFARLFGDSSQAWQKPGRWPLWKLQDHMMHHVCALADARSLPFQIHTGLQEGNGNFIYHSDPALLSNLFMEYPNVRFDLFHIGYPYHQTLSALAKNFRNVFIDFCWANIISPEASVRALVEYLDAVPANKISGFGGDYAFIDGVAGHAFIARENVARALAIKVDQGVFGLDRARELATMIFRDNPARLFGVEPT
jgi:hypothetical protein